MVLVAGYQLAFAVFYIGDCTEGVVLQLEDVVWIIKWFLDALEPPWLDAGEHGGMLSRLSLPPTET
jgi:hypothetical protein